MTRSRKSSSLEEFLVVTVPERTVTVDFVHEIQQLAEDLMTACNRMAASAVEERQTTEQATQTDYIEQTAATSTGCDQKMLNLKLKELVNTNVGWQHRHAKDEKRIAELNERVRLLQQVVEASPVATEAAPEASQSPNPAVDTCSANVKAFDDVDVESLRCKCGLIESEKQKLETRIDSLQTQLESAHDIVRQLEQAVDQLNGSLKSVADEKQSFIDMLQAQILVYREDFECERRDRERAQEKLVELKTELEYLRQRLINENPAQCRTWIEDRRPAMYVTAPQPAAVNPNANLGGYAVTGTSFLGARRPTVEHPYYNYGLLMQGRDEPDCDSVPKNEAGDTSDSATAAAAAAVSAQVVAGDHSDNVDTGTKSRSENNGGYEVDSVSAEEVLRCPNCCLKFTVDEHIDLVDHMEICGH